MGRFDTSRLDAANGDRLPEDTMAPTRKRQSFGTEFPAGEQHFRSARLKCAIACQAYNRQPEDSSPQDRSRLFLEIINCNRSLAVESTLFDHSSSRSSCEAGPRLASAKSSSSLEVDTLQPDAEKPINHALATLDALGASPFPAGTNGKAPEAAAGSGVNCPTPWTSTLFTRTSAVPRSVSTPSLPRLLFSQDGNLREPANGHGAPHTVSLQSPSSTSLAASPTKRNGAQFGGNRFPGQGLAPYIKPPLFVDYGSRLEIGTSTFINRNCTILDNPIHPVKIGERCMIGPNFSIYAISHPLDFQIRDGPMGAPSYALGVMVGDDCWIGGQVTVLGGVSVGKGCVIGAGSLVTTDIPAYHLAFGVPARVIKRVSSPLAGPETENFDSERDENVCYSFGENWILPEWIDSLTYRRAIRVGGRDFMALELTVAVLVALVFGILFKLVLIG